MESAERIDILVGRPNAKVSREYAFLVEEFGKAYMTNLQVTNVTL
jgi:hypothetical protein